MALAEWFVIDAVAHALDSSPVVRDRNRYAASVVNGNYKWQWGLIPDPYRLSADRYYQSVSASALESALFRESQTDVACYHTLPMRGIFEDFSPMSIALEIRDRYPHRMLLYGAASPLDGAAGFEELERQVEEWGIIGVKLYPVDLIDGKLRPYSLADEKGVYPLLQACVDLGIKVVAIHKAVPLGIAPTDPFRPGDIDHAARDFPELAFEIVHGGYAFLDETAMQLSRFPNVYVNLEVTAQLLPKHPAKFATIIGEFLAAGAEDQIFWGTGCSFTHARPLLEAFAAMEMPPELDGFGYPQLTDEVKAKILGINFARVHELDLGSIAAAVASDSLEEGKRNGLAPPWSLL
jgi:predicted TIM-barrel fold metal-dependent hydrolase